MSCISAACLVLLMLGSAPSETTELDQLIEKVRANAWRSKEAVFDYSFVQHERTVVKKPNGKVVENHDRKYRIVPVHGGLLRELLEVDGREPTAKERKKNEKRNDKELKRRRSKLETPEQEAEDYTEGLTKLIELLSVTDYEIVGREERDGRELLGVAFEPSVVKQEKGVTKKLLKHARGTVWLDTETGEPVAMEMGTADKFRLKGVVGVKEASFRMQQVRVQDELWLPGRIESAGLVSLLGMKRRFESTTVFSEHRKAVVSVQEHVIEDLDAEVEELLADP